MKDDLDRFYDEGYEAAQQCPYPDCEGWLEQGSENYGADRDGNRGVMIHYSQCHLCERDPSDYNADNFQDEKLSEILSDVTNLIKYPDSVGENSRKEIAKDIDWYIDEYL